MQSFCLLTSAICCLGSLHNVYDATQIKDWARDRYTKLCHEAGLDFGITSDPVPSIGPIIRHHAAVLTVLHTLRTASLPERVSSPGESPNAPQALLTVSHRDVEVAR